MKIFIPTFIKGGANYGFIYRNKYPHPSILFSSLSILRVLLHLSPRLFDYDTPVYENLKISPCLFHPVLQLSTKEYSSKHTQVFEREIQPHEMVTQSPAIIFSQQGFMLLVFLDKFCLNKVKDLITRTRWSLCSWSLYHWIFSQLVITKNLRKFDVYWKNVLQWIPKIIESTTYALTFAFVILKV